MISPSPTAEITVPVTYLFAAESGQHEKESYCNSCEDRNHYYDVQVDSYASLVVVVLSWKTFNSKSLV